MAKITKQQRAESIERLREWIKPGDTVYTIVRNVSRSGMSRDISLVLIKMDDEGKPYTIHPNYHAARALGWRLVSSGGNDAVRVGGCGMDMAFHLVYELGGVLYPDAHGTGETLRKEGL